MMVTVDFDNELVGDTGEIREIRTNWMLASKLHPSHPMGAQQFPYRLLGTTAGLAEFSRSVGSFLGQALPHPPRAYARVPSLSPASRRRGPRLRDLTRPPSL